MSQCKLYYFIITGAAQNAFSAAPILLSDILPQSQYIILTVTSNLFLQHIKSEKEKSFHIFE